MFVNMKNSYNIYQLQKNVKMHLRQDTIKYQLLYKSAQTTHGIGVIGKITPLIFWKNLSKLWVSWFYGIY